MDDRINPPLNAANATIALDCPWCGEAIRETLAELDAGGLACPGCAIRVEIVDGSRDLAGAPRAPLAA